VEVLLSAYYRMALRQTRRSSWKVLRRLAIQVGPWSFPQILMGLSSIRFGALFCRTAFQDKGGGLLIETMAYSAEVLNCSILMSHGTLTSNTAGRYSCILFVDFHVFTCAPQRQLLSCAFASLSNSVTNGGGLAILAPAISQIAKPCGDYFSYSFSTNISISDVQLLGNAALSGAGMYVGPGGLLHLTQVVYANNVASLTGGGAYFGGSVGTVYCGIIAFFCEFDNNTAGRGGGSQFHSDCSGDVEIHNSNFTLNTQGSQVRLQVCFCFAFVLSSSCANSDSWFVMTCSVGREA
jgi:hypothetical protein